MGPTLSPETSAFKLQTPGKFPEEYKLHSEHGESLKTVIKSYLLSFNCKIQPRCSNFISYCKLQRSIASFRRKVVGNCVLLGYCAAISGISPEERSALLSKGPHLITLPASLPNAAPCPKPTFTGGRTITAWEPSEA